MSVQPVSEAYAIKFAQFEARRRTENFLGGDPHDAPMPFNYFVFAIHHPTGWVVVDTGFNAEVARQRNRAFVRCPSEGLRHLGADPSAIRNVVLSHLHYDHCGNQELFPAAQFHLQAMEMAYATGPCMCQPVLRLGYDAEDITATVRKIYAGRVIFHEDVGEVLPGITVHRIGGHTQGQQVVRVWTRRGYIVLASDAVHFYENFERNLPFPWVHSVADTLNGFRKLRTLADSSDLIVPGHDPAILHRFPEVDGSDGLTVRLD